MNKAVSILDHLGAIFQEVSQAVTSENRSRSLESEHNAKGDKVKWFDLAADEAVCRYLKKRFPCSVVLLSEEGSPRQFGPGQPQFTMVLDPVDGSDNFGRQMAPAGVAIALIPQSVPISIETIQFAFVGDLTTGRTCVAERGQGASCHGRRIRTSSVSTPEKAIISCELNHFTVQPPLASILAGARGVRALGCASGAIAMVASGSLDAHLDLRNRLTPENFLAPSLILTEAGGTITDSAGNRIAEINSLTDRHSVIAAGTPELHSALVQQLKGDSECT
ncbi:MAG: hypothetical protein KAT58_00795 [candidate division Zixibacteria bacterium]|nr:hypothetical protein [candidate division Zixibacteria bacterium]